VVDNFGDIGVAWRLARQLAGEHGIDVTLWVDDLHSFQKICAEISTQPAMQSAQGVTIRHWNADFNAIAPDDMPDTVIEAFGCELPPVYIAAMAACLPKPVWINLEYLTAESWADDCHLMQSHYPSLPLIKYFFFPGFSEKSGGLLMERDLPARRIAFQNDPDAAADFLKGIGVSVQPDVCKISLFCYATAPVTALFEALQSSAQRSVCLVPKGVAFDAVSTFLQQPATVGATASHGSLTVQVVPFLDQPDYDKLLWSCDINFVRGEDSMVRAQWAARPFVWQIYPQEEDAHQVKLTAFLDRYTAQMPPEVAQSVIDTWQAWNRPSTTRGELPWQAFLSALPWLAAHMPSWTGQLTKNGDLAGNLLRFIQKIG
jgi:uncharacterized repeat protein (TIGR03837 family)